MREVASPLHQKRNMIKERLNYFPKSPTTSKKNKLDERKGEDVSKRSIEMPKIPTKLTQIQTSFISCDSSSDLNPSMEPLLVEEGYVSLHIDFPQTLKTDNVLVLAIIPISCQIV